jgi:GNAT superfamily N-acetyltransferase
MGYCRVRDHGAVASVRLVTPDLVVTEIEPEDLPEVLAVRRSNPDRLVRTDGSAGEAGAYDLAMLERDVSVAMADPARHVVVARARADGRAVGYAEVLDEHPEGGCPWLGVVEVHADAHRRGLGRQCVEAVAQRARDDLGARSLRAAADAGDDRAQMFLRSLGFRPVDGRDRASPRGRVRVIVYEAPLVLNPDSLERVVQADDDPLACGNHSCDPNLWMADAITIVARRRIEAGEEATIDYALVTVDEGWRMACRCGSPLCRDVVTGSDWTRHDLQQRYRDHFAPFINQRISLPR